jgi:ABC-type transport system involved in cytochrome bd biosynthesis fused ATPase/permease subunit
MLYDVYLGRVILVAPKSPLKTAAEYMKTGLKFPQAAAKAVQAAVPGSTLMLTQSVERVTLVLGLDGAQAKAPPSWPGGVEVSFGQWQKLALARGFMRDGPLVLVLDEPTAALDAETEHALFERYADFARNAGGTERLTILVSHRFSTVRMADLIVVLDGSRVAEVGTHDDLMARGGQYAELYTIQAAAYA